MATLSSRRSNDGQKNRACFLEGAMNHNVCLNSILQSIERPFANALGESFILMYDNACTHR
ncbi:hypothetical protein ANN_11148, partial [Periplaneta americana]